MERSFGNFQPSSSNKKFQAIFASLNRYFTENSRWVPLKKSINVFIQRHKPFVKVARPSIFIRTPSIFEYLMLKQIDLYCRTIMTYGLQLDSILLRYYFLGRRSEYHLATGERSERTELDFRAPICRSAIGQASCLICARSRTLTFPFCC